jgi:hypothetical protein
VTVTVVMAVLLLAAFIAGFGAGVVYVELRNQRRRGHTARMEPGPGNVPDLQPAETGPPSRRRVSFRTVVLILIAVVLSVNLVLGVLLIIARAATQNAEKDRTALIHCTTRYNKDLSVALDERDARASASTSANLAWLRNFRDQLQQPKQPPDAARDRFLASLNAYINALEQVQSGRSVDAYPPFDRCAVLASRHR